MRLSSSSFLETKTYSSTGSSFPAGVEYLISAAPAWARAYNFTGTEDNVWESPLSIALPAKLINSKATVESGLVTKPLVSHAKSGTSASPSPKLLFWSIFKISSLTLITVGLIKTNPSLILIVEIKVFKL